MSSDWNQRICFSAKLSPTFGSFSSAVICAQSHLAFSVHLRQYLLGIGEYLQFDPPRGQLLCRTELQAAGSSRRSTGLPSQSEEALPAPAPGLSAAMHVIVSIILLALIVGGLILALRLRLLLDISAASPLLGPSLP